MSRISSREAHKLASNAARKHNSCNTEWNADYVDALHLLGFWLMPWPKGADIPPDVVEAPWPASDEEWTWHVPSLVVPTNWTRNHG